ncbi:hypothetical protein Leryth_016802 [Lithospermum erythrorhizon]|nr:hypothetical protein Leryth_016802 [Lithospermum erythrorhizon]
MYLTIGILFKCLYTSVAWGLACIPRRESPWGMPEGDHRQPKPHRCDGRVEDVIHVLLWRWWWELLWGKSQPLLFITLTWNHQREKSNSREIRKAMAIIELHLLSSLCASSFSAAAATTSSSVIV